MENISAYFWCTSCGRCSISLHQHWSCGSWGEHNTMDFQDGHLDFRWMMFSYFDLLVGPKVHTKFHPTGCSSLKVAVIWRNSWWTIDDRCRSRCFNQYTGIHYNHTIIIYNIPLMAIIRQFETLARQHSSIIHTDIRIIGSNSHQLRLSRVYGNTFKLCLTANMAIQID